MITLRSRLVLLAVIVLLPFIMFGLVLASVSAAATGCVLAFVQTVTRGKIQFTTIEKYLK